MIAIPSVRGTGPTGWSCPFIDRDVAFNVIPMAGRRPGDAPWRGLANSRRPLLLGTRFVTTTGRGAFDARLAQGRRGSRSRQAAHHPITPRLLSTRASAWSDPARFWNSLSPWAIAFPGGLVRQCRLARSTMGPMPRAHRDRHAGALMYGSRLGSSCGKGVRAA